MFWGIDVDVAMDDPTNISANQFVASPVALTNKFVQGSDLMFIEVGPIRNCTAASDCKLRPYYARQKLNQDYELLIDSTRLLSSGGRYGYRVFRTADASETQFQTVFCSSSGCGVIATVNMERSSFPHVFTAGESTTGMRWLTPISVYSAKHRKQNADYENWCYTSTSITFSDGIITPCNTSTYGWNFIAAKQVFLPLIRG